MAKKRTTPTDPIPEHANEAPVDLLDLNPVYTYPLGLVCGTVEALDGRRLVRVRTDRLRVDDALRAALADPGAPGIEGT